MDEKLISASRTIKNLGIIFEDNFKFEEHMGIILNNANSKLGIIKNTFHECPYLNTVVQHGPLILSRTINKLRKYRKGLPN